MATLDDCREHALTLMKGAEYRPMLRLDGIMYVSAFVGLERFSILHFRPTAHDGIEILRICERLVDIHQGEPRRLFEMRRPKGSPNWKRVMCMPGSWSIDFFLLRPAEESE